MKNKIYLFAFLILAHFHSHAQYAKSNYQWRFGHNSGVSFSSGSPVSVSGSMDNANEGNSTISDSLGNLLFYCDDKGAYDKNNTLMPSNPGALSNTNATQGVLIIPFPGNPLKYYIFGTSDWSWAGNTFYYCTVDMSLRGGLGDFTGPNYVYRDSISNEQMAATWHANGKDIWILTHQRGNKNYLAWLVTSSGVSITPVISSVGMNYSGFNCYGSIRFSHFCNHIVSALGGNSPETIQLLDFDNSTGVISNPRTLGTSSTIPNAYSAEFSPDDSKLYVTAYNGNFVDQFDLSNGNPVSTLTNIASTTTGTKSSVLLGPDGKIYVNISGGNYLDVINSPNSLGTACNYSTNAVTLSGNCGLGLPNFMSTSIPCGTVLSSHFTPTDTVFCGEGGGCVDFQDHSLGNPTGWKWYFPGATPDTSTVQNPTNICYYNPGTYAVTLVVTNSSGSDSITISPMVTFATSPPAPLINFKGGDTLYTSHACGYQWFFNGTPIPGATDSFYVASQPGVYAVQTVDCVTKCRVISSGFTVSVNELNGEGSLTVYPNPSNGVFMVFGLPFTVDGTIDVYNALGEKVYSDIYNGKEKTVKYKLSPGIYFVQIKDENKAAFQKIVIE